jgi:hypothetical protein
VNALNQAMDAHEGCNLAGWLDVQRVAGNFHISVHAEEFLLLTKARGPGPPERVHSWVLQVRWASPSTV